jgi:hypothetical protein
LTNSGVLLFSLSFRRLTVGVSVWRRPIHIHATQGTVLEVGDTRLAKFMPASVDLHAVVKQPTAVCAMQRGG